MIEVKFLKKDGDFMTLDNLQEINDFFKGNYKTENDVLLNLHQDKNPVLFENIVFTYLSMSSGNNLIKIIYEE